jgi:hypothetical protein
VRGGLLLAVVVAACGFASTAGAATGDLSLSSNWAGYAVTGTEANGSPTSFSVVSGSWTQPIASCTGAPTWSSFWVGLGGFDETSQALEQIGTDSDCDASGRPVYYVWYELVPEPPVQVRLKLSPGDRVSAVVVVHGTSVILRLRNLTRNTVFTRHSTVSTTDVTSAEWIAEAPSNCDGPSCDVLPLTNFGTVSFTGAATVGDGRAAPLASWTVTPIELVGDGRLAAMPASSGAVPSPVGADGGSFSISYSDELPAP